MGRREFNRTLLADARDKLERCLRCGLCREVCPAFRATGEERFSPRGRLALLAATLEGEDFGKPFRETLSYCLACRACAERCPSGVAGDLLVLAARATGLCRGGLPFFKSWAFRLALGRPRVLAGLMRGLAFAQRMGVSRAVLRVLSLPAGLELPLIPTRPFDADAAFCAAEGERKGEVIYFAGCGTNYLYPESARAVVALLRRAGYNVVVPPGRRCCGVPALVSGDFRLARRLASANVAALAGERPIVTDCGSCGLALTFFYNDVLAIPGADAFRRRVRDFTQMLDPDLVAGAGTTRVAYHDACHLARGMGVKNEPRALLRRCGELAEIRAPGGVVCCGGAGAYGVEHGDVLAAIGGERADAVAATAADVVVAGCPACVFYLNQSLKRRGVTMKARHTADVLARRLGPRSESP